VAERTSALSAHDPLTLVELVNRVVDRGIVLSGDITISVADIDLLYLDLRLMLCSAERLHRAVAPHADDEARSDAAPGTSPGASP
jgi:hypothetical protein